MWEECGTATEVTWRYGACPLNAGY